MNMIIFDNSTFKITKTTAGLVEVHMDTGSLLLDGDTYRVLNSDGVVLKETNEQMTIHTALRWATDAINYGV